MLVTRTVYVTKDHIRKGEAASCFECPGALAINETFPEIAPVKVFPSGIEYQYRGRATVKPPEVLRSFMRRFDEQRFILVNEGLKLAAISPISFSLTMLIPVTKTIP